VTLPTWICRRDPRRPWAAGFLILGLALAMASCTTTADRPARPSGPDVNLSGFPPDFRQGYSDGCASARGSRVRNEQRFKDDPQYASGWRDGFDICGKKR
jgi:hypothetical protein